MKKLKFINRNGQEVFLTEQGTKKVKVWVTGSRKVSRTIRLNSFTFQGENYDLEDFK